MARKLIEYKISDTDTVAYSGYNSTKTVLGPMIYKYSATSLNEYYISPPTIGFRLMSQDTGLNGFSAISTVNYNDDIDLIFLSYTPSTTCRVLCYTFNKKTSTYSYLGMINSITHNATNSNWNGIYATMDYYTAGTVSVVGKTVSGDSTNWGSNYINAGSRIGFGSTNPQNISTWYEISNVPLETARLNGLAISSEVDSLGRIYVGGGTFTTYSYLGTAFTSTRIIRLNSDGSPDTTFNTGSGFNSNVRRIKIDPTNINRVYFVGDFTTYNGVTVNYITRLNVSDGSIDSTWSGGTGFNNFVYDIDIDSLGRVYVTGIFTTYKGSAAGRLCRLTSSGDLDTGFSGYATSSGLNYTISPGSTNGYCLAVEPSTDKIYVGGLYNSWGGQSVGGAYNVIRINTNGVVDTSYTATTQFAGGTNLPYSIVPDPTDGGVYIGGGFTSYSGALNNYIIKITSGGTKDNSFNNTTGFGNLVTKIRRLSDGKLIVMGSFTTYKGVSALYIIKLNTDGSIDNSFTPETNTSGIQWFQASASLSDGFGVDSTTGKIYATSQTSTVTFGGLIAYNSGGTINQDFYGVNTQRLNLSTSATTYPPGTPYVIEDLRISLSRNMGNTSANGLYVIKGIKLTDFVSGTTSISPTTIGYYGIAPRTCYWLPNGVNSSSLAGCNLTLDEKINETSQYSYLMSFNGLTIGVFNVRSLFRSTSSSTIVFPNDTLILTTSLGFDSGITNFANPIITTTQTGSASGVKSLYYARSTSVRQIPLSNLQNGVNPLLFTDSQNMSEVPPGNTTTYPATNSLYFIDYMPEIDRFIITTNGTSTKSYITKFLTTLTPPTLTSTFWSRDTYNQLSYDNSFERAFLVNNQQLQGPLSDTNSPKYPDTQGNSNPCIKSSNGWLHYSRGVATTENIIYSIPLSTDEQYVSTSNNVIITPKYIIPNLISITGFYLNTLKEIGSSVFSQSPEPIFTDFRTTGIDDNSGEWINFSSIDDLNGLLCNNTTNSITIQFRFRFRVAGINCYPNRLYGFTFTYEDDTVDSHYSSSVSKSNLNSKIFAFQQIELFGGTIPNMRVRVYNANTGDIILYDTVNNSSLGTWEYSTDGTTWNPWSSSADVIGNYIRYTANYLPSNYKLRVGLNTV